MDAGFTPFIYGFRTYPVIRRTCRADAQAVGRKGIAGILLCTVRGKTLGEMGMRAGLFKIKDSVMSSRLREFGAMVLDGWNQGR